MFCSHCGSKNADDGKFCSHCGSPLAGEKNMGQNQASKTTHTLTIFRESQMFLINPPVNLRINGKMNRAIANGETINFELEENYYEIEFSQAFRKKVVKLNLISNMQITMKWNRMTGAIDTQVTY